MSEEEKLKLALALLFVARCPNCDGSGAYQVSEDDWEQCQWCYEKTKLFPEQEVILKEAQDGTKD